MFHEYSARQKYYEFTICHLLLSVVSLQLKFSKNIPIYLSICFVLYLRILFSLCEKIFSTVSLSNIFATKKKLYKLSNYHSSIKIYHYPRFHLFPWNYQSLIQQILIIGQTMEETIFDSIVRKNESNRRNLRNLFYKTESYRDVSVG